MKFNRRQLRRLINETVQELMSEDPTRGRLDRVAVAALRKGVSANKNASLVFPIDRNELFADIGGGGLDRYKNKPYYILNTEDNDAMAFLPTGVDTLSDEEMRKRADDGDEKAAEILAHRSRTKTKGVFMVGQYTSKGDPYTYDKVGSSRLKVISGPKAGPIGKTFKLTKEKEAKLSQTTGGFKSMAAKIMTSSSKGGSKAGSSGSSLGSLIQEDED